MLNTREGENVAVTCPILTVVIPAYNVEKYIEYTICSLMDSKKEQDIEILIVDDGSTDHTGKIADDYAGKYSFIKALHQPNGGHGAAINTGIRNAQGKYFKLLDGDDWVDPAGFSCLVDLLKEAEEDIILCDYQEVYVSERKEKKVTYYFPAGKTLSMNELHIDKLISMHSHTFRTKLLKELPREIDRHCFYVDMEYILFPLPFAQNFRYEKINVYQYRLDRVGQSVSAEGFRRHYREDVKVLYTLLQYYYEYKNKAKESEAINYYMPQRIFDMFYRHILKCIWYFENKEISISEYLRAFDRKFKITAPELYYFDEKIDSRRNSLSQIQLALLRKTGFCMWPVVRIKKVICEIWRKRK